MSKKRLMGRFLPLGACGVAFLLWAQSGHAADKANKRAVCTAAFASYKSAIEREQAGHFREARDLLTTCAQATACGGLVPKCKGRLEKMTGEMPSIVPVVTDENGAPRVDVEVKIDGQVLATRLDGKGLPVDPGLHEFSFATDRGVFATEKIMIVEGQHNRAIAVSMRPAVATGPVAAGSGTAAGPPAAVAKPSEEAAPAATTDGEKPSTTGAETAATPGPSGASRAAKHGHSVLPFVLAGAGVAGLGAGALLTFWGNKDNDALSQCAPNCAQSGVDHIRTLYIVSDLSIGVGAVALGLAAWLFANRAPDDQPPAHTAWFDVQPTRSGGLGSVSVVF